MGTRKNAYRFGNNLYEELMNLGQMFFCQQVITLEPGHRFVTRNSYG